VTQTLCRALVLLSLFAFFSPQALGQLDPEKRKLLQLGYNQPTQGRGPIAAYGFYYHNEPNFYSTNLALRLAVAPVYVDGELGIREALSPQTDLGIGLAGGGFAHSYFEVRDGIFHRNESFVGHGGEASVSLYQRFNPNQTLPFWLIVRGSLHQSFFERDSDTDPLFELPNDQTAFHLRSGIRLGGQEPSMTEPLALELSAWHRTQYRSAPGTYGFDHDRRVDSVAHHFWTRGLLQYMFESEHWIQLSATAGASARTDRLSAYRLGGHLPFAAEFPLNIPGYYFQELSARRYVLVNGHYSFPLEPSRRLRLTLLGATGGIDDLPGLEQDRSWHSGVGGGLTFISPTGAWLAAIFYGHGIHAIRREGRGAHQIGFLFQYDFLAKPRGKRRFFVPDVSPMGSQGGERIFR
jgi:hypothetical protein